jgi:hypothetical protein
MKHDIDMTGEFFKLTPAAGLGGAFIFGIPIATWVLWVTGMYYSWLLATLLRDHWIVPYYRAWKEKRNVKDRSGRGLSWDAAPLDDGAVPESLGRKTDSPYL